MDSEVTRAGDASAEHVPIFYIEGDWVDILSNVGARVKISCQARESPAKCGELVSIKNSQSNSDICVSATGGFNVDLCVHNTIRIMYNPYSCIFVSPQSLFTIHKNNVTSLAVSETTTMCVSVSTENGTDLTVWSREDSRVLRNLKGHVGDIYKCRWFPSGTVIISISADMRLKIWDAESGKCGATLVGHTQGVTDVAIVDRGRNIISVSRDGCCKLWDCGKSTCLADLIKVSSAINCCAISDCPSTIVLPEVSPSSDREIGTENKILLIGCEDKSLICIAIRSRSILFQELLADAINCCCNIKPGIFAVGCQNGYVCIINIAKNPKYIQSFWYETIFPALCITPVKDIGFFTSYEDGSCIYRPVEKNITSRLQLSGNNYEAINDMYFDNKYVYTACVDGLIRRYFVNPYVSMIK